MEVLENLQTELKHSHVALVGLAGKKVADVMKKCKVTEMTVYNWINGKTVPENPKHVEILMKIYGIGKYRPPKLEDIKKG